MAPPLRNLHNQLLLSHFLLIILMVGMMAVGVIIVMKLGNSMDHILHDNYDSVEAAQQMDDALAAQKDDALLMLLGREDLARTQYPANWDRFVRAFQLEANNITEAGEQDAVDDIKAWAGQYRSAMKDFIANPSGGRAVAFDTLEPLYRKLKARVEDVRSMNQQALRNGDRRAREQASQASIAGIVATMVAISLSVWVALRSISYSLLPLHTLARQAEEIGAGHWNQRIELHRSDEIGVLADAFNRMAAQLREAWTAEEQRRYVLERMANMALDNLQDAVLVVDSRGMVMHANRMAARLFAPVSEPGTYSMNALVQEAAVVRALGQSLEPREAEVEDSEYVPLKRDGETRIYRLRTNSIKDEDRLLGAVAILEDVTHLQELDRLKSEFIGVASHELKTPVTSLLLSVQLLEEEAGGPLTPAQRDIVSAQRQDLQRLERTTKDLLDIDRLESGAAPAQLVPVPAGELVKVAADALAAEARTRGVALEAHVAADSGSVVVDRHQIIRVLINLLSNAVRHSPNGHVTVTATPGPMGVTFAVQDDGSGISAEYLPRIFDRFVQVPGSTRGGAGLGLSIARGIVRAHHSDIQVETAPQRGSTFRFTLPSEVSHG